MKKVTELRRVIAWYKRSSMAVMQAGGMPDAILRDIPDEVIEKMIANNIFLTYDPLGFGEHDVSTR
jgi:hypothetical protein